MTLTPQQALETLARHALAQPDGDLPPLTLQVRFGHDGETPDVTEVCAYLPKGGGRMTPAHDLSGEELRLAARLASAGISLGRVQPTPTGWSALFILTPAA